MHEALYKKCHNMTADEIHKYLISDTAADDIFIRHDNITYKICDIATLFVAVAYISDIEMSNKNSLRKNAYLALLKGDRSVFGDAWQLIDLLTLNKPYSGNLKIRILKGGSYKIKNYYLENSLLSDIRGASVLLTYVEEQLIPQIIADRYIPECIVYSGGGNIFAIVPESCDESFALELESRGKELLISADIAYYVSDIISFSDLLGKKYKETMASVENALNERKKLIVNSCSESRSYFLNKNISIVSDNKEDCFTVPVKAKEISDKSICSACGKRTAFYSISDSKLCAACLHKHAVGTAAKHSKYLRLYNKYNSASAETVNNLGNIADRNEYIAIVYGDGNNMGGIIQKFTNITQMMEFSRDVKTITIKSVFESMGSNNMKKFEVVGLGGDDIFVIVEGEKAINFTISLIQKYNKQFEKYKSQGTVSTLSAGIAIAKYKTPVQVVLDKAEQELKRAKDIAKKKSDNPGSLSFVIMDTFDGGDSVYYSNNEEISGTMLPYYTDAAIDIIKFAKKMKTRCGKTRLRNVLDAFQRAESSEEAELFLQYMNAKEKNPQNKIELSTITGYEKTVGYYIADKKKYYIWSDLMEILDFIE